MIRSRPHRFPRPLRWAMGLVLVTGALVVGVGALVWSGLHVPDLEAEHTATSAVPPASAVEGEVTVRLDAAARPVSGNSPEHLGVQPFVDLDASDLRGPVLVTLEAEGTDVGPIAPAGDLAGAGGTGGGELASTAWRTATATSVQEVVDPGSGRLNLGSVKVVVGCPLGEACTARWRYRIEALDGERPAATVVWGVSARAVYSSGDRARRAPEGATIDVGIADPEVSAPSPEPVVLDGAGLGDGATIVVRGPAGSDGVVRATLLDGANGTAPDFVVAPAEGQPPGSVVTVGPSIWEVPLLAGSCDSSGCTVRLTVTGRPPPGATLRVDARAHAPLGAPSIDDQLVVTVE